MLFKHFRQIKPVHHKCQHALLKICAIVYKTNYVLEEKTNTLSMMMEMLSQCLSDSCAVYS